MKKIVLAAITTLTLASTASAWQNTTYSYYGNSVNWNSYGSGGFSSGSCYSYGNQIMCNSW